MARLARCGPTGFPQHIIQRGNNRQVCYVSPENFIAHQKWLDEYASIFKVAMHVWVFMTNPAHLLVTPGDDQGVSLMMQALGRRYAGYFNRRYRELVEQAPNIVELANIRTTTNKQMALG